MLPIAAYIFLFSIDRYAVILAAVLLYALVRCSLVLRKVWKFSSPRGFELFILAMISLVPLPWIAAGATDPSSAPRKQVTGQLEWIEPHRARSSDNDNFTLLVGSGAQMRLEAAADVPSFAEGQTVAITYLDEKLKGRSPRAISITILTGSRAGWHKAVDANWLGRWLLIPLDLLTWIGLGILWYLNRRKPVPPER